MVRMIPQGGVRAKRPAGTVRGNGCGREEVLPWCHPRPETAMPTTTLKLPDALKQRIAPLARAAGKTPHAWMIDALEAQVQLADLRESFLRDARAEAAAIDAGGPLYAMEDVAAYVRARARGAAAARPAPVGTT
ncbi:MAG TPA: hypothetical protein PK929_13760, partial [Quisquiliibacterium sp.]|nr:hypothetical protein [Quisquiliibacterium sp.]